MKLASLLLDADDSVKTAGIESPDQTQGEMDFSRIAFAFLRDRAPGLLPHLVGFENVEREDDGSRAVGLFGFAVDQSFYYVPVFFLNNQIKGMDLLYSKNENLFVPLREAWVNRVVNRKSVALGQPGGRMDKMQFSTPDFRFIRYPPVGGPSDASQLKVSHVKADLEGAYEWMQMTTANALGEDPAMGDALLKLAEATIEGRRDFDKGHSELHRFLSDFGGPEAADRLIEWTHNIEFAKSASAFHNMESLLESCFSEKFMKRAEAPIIEVCDAVRADMTAEDRQLLLRDGFRIMDKRAADDKSVAYAVDMRSSVYNPDHAGKYNIVLAGGVEKDLFVLKPSVGKLKPSLTIVYDPKKGRAFTCTNDSVFATGDVPEADKGLEEVFSKAKDAWGMTTTVKPISGEEDSKNRDTKYILVNALGKCTPPFSVENYETKGDLGRFAIDWFREPMYRDALGHQTINDENDWNNDDTLVLEDSEGQPRRVGNTLIVPAKSWKILEVSTRRSKLYVEGTGCGAPCAAGGDSDSKTKDPDPGFIPATYAEARESLMKHGCHDITVGCDDGFAYSIRVDDGTPDANLSRKEACVRLVRDIGLSDVDARSMMKEACDSYKSRRFVKFAQVSMPPPPEQTYAADPQLGIEMQQPIYAAVKGQTMSQPPKPGMNIGPGSGVNIGGEGQTQSGGMPDDAAQLAQQAAQTGQKNVFDHAVIGGLAKTYDSGAQIDQFMPDLMKSLDRLGRILFLFYWKNDEFSERYGDQDMQAMEDNLRGVFRNYGDLILKLKQKTIDTEETGV